MTTFILNSELNLTSSPLPSTDATPLPTPPSASSSSSSSTIFTSNVYEISTCLEKINGSIRIKHVSCDDLDYILLNHTPPKEIESESSDNLNTETPIDTTDTTDTTNTSDMKEVVDISDIAIIVESNTEKVFEPNTYDNTSPLLYRSVVLDTDRNILCYSPPNGVPIESLFEQYDSCKENICVNEIIEGTMINLFFDPRKNDGKGGWEIATRSNIQGKNWFYRTEYNNTNPTQKTFQQMFLDCFGFDLQSIDDITYFNSFDKKYCYSFVMQHPSNHIVLYCQSPTVYLVSVYEKLAENKVRFISPDEYETWDIFVDIPIYFPTRMPYENCAEDYKIKYCNLNSGHHFLGFMFTNKTTGARAALSNPVYEWVKELRGNNPNLQYHYFTLLKSNQVGAFLYYFPTYQGIFEMFQQKYEYFISCVHRCYFSYYVKKENIPIYKDFFIHVSRIHHQIYLPAIAAGQKRIITREVVKEYFDGLSPSAIVYALQYEVRYLQKLSQEDQGKREEIIHTKVKL